MALINTGPDYTRSGENFLNRWANRISMLPFGGIVSYPMGMLGTVVEAAGWLLRGKVLSAATVLAAGTVSNSLNAATGIIGAPLEGVRWFVNAGSGVATGSTIGTHGRALTEGAIGMVTGALGMKPTVLRSYTAGIGSIGGGSVSGPGQFTSAEAARRGQDSNQLWSQKMSGEAGAYVSPSLTGQRGVA